MADQDRLVEFGEKTIEDNERKYGAQVRAKYGDAAMDASNARLRGLTKKQWDAINQDGAQAEAQLKLAMETGDPTGEAAIKAAAMHRVWLGHFGEYDDDMHIGLGEMYVADERFKAYYDAVKPGAAEFLRDAIKEYVSQPNIR